MHTSNSSRKVNQVSESNLREGDIIDYKVVHNDSWKRAIILSRATKRRSKWGAQWYNVQNAHSGATLSVNLDDVFD